MRISTHEPFAGKNKAIRDGSDILSTSVIFENPTKIIKVAETDDGIEIRNSLKDLKKLLKAYENGDIKENMHEQKYRK